MPPDVETVRLEQSSGPNHDPPIDTQYCAGDEVRLIRRQKQVRIRYVAWLTHPA
jgi:hypothetical protein